MDDIDDDRILPIDTPDVRRLKSFKVPKKNITSKSSFDKLSLDSSEFKENIQSKIVSGFKNPNSNTSLKILSAYSICNVEVESMFNRRKLLFKREYSTQSAVEYFGFLYISNIVELRKIVQQGRLKMGNLPESVLGQPEMGVSVSQYSDLYHPGDNKSCPKSGFLLIVKYIKGRVCFVVEDSNPMEPQPNYDCHMSKSYNHESFPSVARAFHTTQVYLYEYSDDLDLIEEPSQVIPWGAVEFVWAGPLLYKLAAVPILVSRDGNESLYKDPALKNADKRTRLLSRTTGTPTQRMKQSYTDCTPLLCTQLQLQLSQSKDDIAVLDIPVTILSYHGSSSWHSLAALYISSWQVCELMEWMAFEQDFLRAAVKDPLLQQQQQSEDFSLDDLFNKRVTISRHKENRVTSASGCQFVNYLRLVVNDPSRDRAKMARLIDHFNETKTVGRVRLFDGDDDGSLVFVFPDSTLSQNFGIPSVKTLDVNYLHVLILTKKSLQYNQSSDLIDEFVEIELKTNILKICDSQSSTEASEEAMIPLHVLKQSLHNQNNVQKCKLREMCGSVVSGPLGFTDNINFDNIIEAAVPLPCSAVSPTVPCVPVSGDSIDERPYDPTENMIGLSDSSSSSKRAVSAPVKRPANSRSTSVAVAVAVGVTAETEAEEPVAKIQKREEKKTDLSNKLLELFAKIESPKDSTLQVTAAQCEAAQVEEHGGYGFERSPKSTMISLDRNRFPHTHFRKGVSMYVPQSPPLLPPPQSPSLQQLQGGEQYGRPRDQDLRYPEHTHNNSNTFEYHPNSIMRYRGVNR